MNRYIDDGLGNAFGFTDIECFSIFFNYSIKILLEEKTLLIFELML